jgi:hypothetical protein
VAQKPDVGGVADPGAANDQVENCPDAFARPYDVVDVFEEESEDQV